MSQSRDSKYEKNLFILGLFPIILIIISLIFSDIGDLFKGLIQIVVHPDVLLVDYLEVAGLYPTLFNVGFTTLITIVLIYIFRVPLTGPLISAVLTIAGFSFMGKNFFNIWPIFFGGYLFSKFSKTKIENVIVPIYFATTMGPIFTKIAFGLGLDYVISIPLTFLVGGIIGFFLVPIASHLVKAHDGYNLYNIGFVGGVISIFVASTMRSLGVELTTQSVISTAYSDILKYGITVASLLYIVIGYLLNNKSFKGYGKVFDYSGRLFANFVDELGYGIAYINIGLMGLISVAYVLLVKSTFNGPILAGILTVAAFSSFGKNPKNSIPVMLGIFVASKLPIYTTNHTTTVIAALFGTTLAPIAGEYGPIAGFVAGLMHMIIAPNLSVVHGGMHLYNNGFSGGIVGMLMAPVLNYFFVKNSDK